MFPFDKKRDQENRDEDCEIAHATKLPPFRGRPTCLPPSLARQTLPAPCLHLLRGLNGNRCEPIRDESYCSSRPGWRRPAVVAALRLNCPFQVQDCPIGSGALPAYCPERWFP